ncbi:non-ribosomal peptide synthetase [Micromonospora violae]|nr:non-ribosomal peptide synthetase [Micromonospora violae]
MGLGRAALAGRASGMTTAGPLRTSSPSPAWADLPDPGRGTVVARLRSWAEEQPDAPAVRFADDILSYRELDERATELAVRLRRRGVGAESPVAVLVERGPALTVAILAVLKAGGCYVPVLPGFPPATLAGLVTRLHPPVILVDDPARGVALPHGPHVVTVGAVDDEPVPGTAAVAPAPPRLFPEQLACVLFTSGSTGEPKGVAVTHGDIVALAADPSWRPAALRRVLVHSPHAWDAMTLEVWVPLLNGREVLIAPPGPLDIDRYAELLGAGRVSGLWITAGLFALLAEENPACFAGLVEVWTGGDVVSPRAVARVAARCPQVRIANGYGPSETTVFATRHDIRPGHDYSGVVPIGRPLAGMNAHVLDDALRPVATGIAGELYVSGPGVVRGYHSSPGETAARFVPDPFAADGTRMYRTGDIVRCNADGEFEFVGRADDQVKIRGHRVETGEVEVVLGRHPAVARCVVVARDDGTGDKRLLAYVLPAEGDGTRPAALRDHLARMLPGHMVPDAVTTVASIPLTRNGKVDRAALPDMPRSAGSSAGAGAQPGSSASAMVDRLCQVFAEALGVPRLSPDDNFFELGGHSLIAVRLVRRLREKEGIELTIQQFLEGPTVADVLARQRVSP